MVLTLLLIAAPPVENTFKFIGHHVITCGLITLPHLIHDFEESYDPLVGKEVDARLGEKCSILLLVLLVDAEVYRDSRLANGSSGVLVPTVYWWQLLRFLLDVFHYQDELLVSYFPIMVGVKLHYQIIHYIII